MKFKLLAMTALFGVLAAACGDSTTSSGSGGGGTGGGGTGGSGNVTTTTTNTTTTGTGLGTCDDLGTCQGDGMTPDSGCFECLVIDDGTVASDGGTCLDAYVTCFGTDDMCTGGNADCCSFSDCLAACPDDDPATAGVDENLDCICTNDGMQCGMTQTDPNTCMGANPNGVNDYIGFLTCVLDGCATSCQ